MMNRSNIRRIGFEAAAAMVIGFAGPALALPAFALPALAGIALGIGPLAAASAQECDPQESARIPGDRNDYERFGAAVSIDGDRALVGAPGDDRRGDAAGAAQVFERIGGVWQEVADLLAGDGAAFDEFGSAVGLSGSVALVGSRGDGDSGSAYVFERIDGGWSQVAKLLPSDIGVADLFGGSVAIDGNLAVIADSQNDGVGDNAGAAYVFEKIDGAWVETAKLTASDAAAEDFFGSAVAVDESTVIVGAMFDDDQGSGSGSAYVFEKVDGNWIQTAKLTASDGAAEDGLGHWGAVAIDGDTAVVGTWFHDDPAVNSGAAYVFERTEGIWSETEAAKLTASDAAANDHFCRVALDGDRLLVGAYEADGPNGGNSGAVYLFRSIDGVWMEVAKRTASGGGPNHVFGSAVAVSGDRGLVGAVGNNYPFVGVGAAYFFDLGCEDGPGLEALGSCPGPMRFKVAGATPGGRIAFLYARGEGAVVVPPGKPCAGTTIGLDATVKLATVQRASGRGIARFDIENVPPRACGRVVLQAIDLDACAVTNVVSVR